MNKVISLHGKFLPFFLFSCFFLCAVLTTAQSDDREENIDVFLVLDKSLSMVEEIDAVKEYVRTSIVDTILQPGDSLVLIAFYGNADTLIASQVGADKDEITATISSIDADGRFTDIGNALDSLKTAVDLAQLYGTQDRRKYLMLITDGIQEAPPTSNYWSPDGSFNHFFLENTKTIQKEGWKIVILGIGTDTVVQDIARELSGTSVEVVTDETATQEDLVQELVEKTRDFLGTIEPTGLLSIGAVGESGETLLSLRLKSFSYEDSRTVVIDRIILDTTDTRIGDILEGDHTFSIGPDEEITVQIPVSITPSLEPGTYEGTVTLTFGGDTAITPAVLDAQFRVKSFLENRLWIIPLGILLLGLLILLVILLVRALKDRPKRSPSGKKAVLPSPPLKKTAAAAPAPKSRSRGAVRFTCEIIDGPARKRAYEIKGKNRLFVADGVMGISITPKKLGRPAAELYAEGTSLKMNVLTPDNFSVKALPPNLIGKNLEIVKSNGRKAELKFEKI